MARIPTISKFAFLTVIAAALVLLPAGVTRADYRGLQNYNRRQAQPQPRQQDFNLQRYEQQRRHQEFYHQRYPQERRHIDCIRRPYERKRRFELQSEMDRQQQELILQIIRNIGE